MKKIYKQLTNIYGSIFLFGIGLVVTKVVGIFGFSIIPFVPHSFFKGKLFNNIQEFFAV